MDRKRLAARSKPNGMHSFGLKTGGTNEMNKLSAMEPRSMCVCVSQSMHDLLVIASEAQLKFHSCVPRIFEKWKIHFVLFPIRFASPFCIYECNSFFDRFLALQTLRWKWNAVRSSHRTKEDDVRSARLKGTTEVLIRLLLSMKWVNQQDITARHTHSQSILWFIHFVNENDNENEMNNINGSDKGIA